MVKIKSYKNFLNEEESLKNWTVGAAMTAGVLNPFSKTLANDSTIVNKTSIEKSFQDKETIGDENTYHFDKKSNKGKSGVSVVSTKIQTFLGKSLGYYAEFKNNTDKKVDGIKWIATFTDNFGEVLGTREGTWQSGNLIPSIEPGESVEDSTNNFVKGTTKIQITITQVHFER
jgi:hypothetical protein